MILVITLTSIKIKMIQLKYFAVLMVLLNRCRKKELGHFILILALIIIGGETLAQSSYTFTYENKTCVIFEIDSSEKYTAVDSIKLGGYPFGSVVSLIGNKVYIVDINLRANGSKSYVLETGEIINDSLHICGSYFSSTWVDSRLSVNIIGAEFVLTYKESPLDIMPTAQERYFINIENISDFALIVSNFWDSNKTQKSIRK